jgi:rhodanese-related sulfurtransferase
MKLFRIFLCACASFLPLGHGVAADSVSPISVQAPPTGENRNLNAGQAAALLKEKSKVTILDVRTPEEYATGHLEKALNINYYDKDFQKKAARLDQRKDYLIYCASGIRSSKARQILNKIGVVHLYNMEGGIKAWQKAALPVVK